MKDLKKIIKLFNLENNFVVRFIRLNEQELKDVNVDPYIVPKANKDNCIFSEKSFFNDLDKFTKWNQYGGIYFSPLGAVENSDDVNPEFIFYEVDDYEILKSPEKRDELIQKQIDKVNDLEKELGIKTTIIETFKSIHVYIKLSSSVEKNEWVYLQKRLIQKMGSDKSIKNIARLMRLPDFNHVRIEDGSIKYKEVKLLQLSEETVSVEDLDSKYLPEYDLSFWEPSDYKTQITRQKKSGIKFIDLSERFLEGFNTNGRRGWATCKCPVHGGNSTDSLHIHHESGAYKCWSGCDSKEIFNKTLEIAKTNGYNPPQASESIITYLDLHERVTTIVNENPDPFIRELKLSQVKNEFNFGDNKVWDNLQSLANKELENNDVEKSIYSICKVFNSTIEVDDIFESSISSFIKANAINLGHEPIVLATLFLSYIMPFIQNKITLDVYGDDSFTDRLVFFHVLVGTTGTGKTGLMKIFGKHLKDIQKSYDIDYRSALANHKSDKDRYPEPSQRIVWVGETTEAARFHIMKDEGINSTLMEVDEMSGFFDKTKSSTPSDPHFIQDILSTYNGLPLSKATKSDGTINVTLNYSIVGGVQPQELDKTISHLHGDPKGFLPRFMMTIIKHNTTPDIKNHLDSNDFDVKGFMRDLENLQEQKLTFSPEALLLINKIQKTLEQKKKEYNSPEFINGIPKFITQLYRFSGIIHLVNKTFSNKPIGVIDVDDVSGSEVLITYFLSNYKLLFPKTLEEKVYYQAVQKGHLSWYDVKNLSYKDFEGSEKSVRELNDVLYMMSELGFGDYDWNPSDKKGLFIPYGENDNHLKFVSIKYQMLLEQNGKISLSDVKDDLKKKLTYGDSSIENILHEVINFISEKLKDKELGIENDYLIVKENLPQEKDIPIEEEEEDLLTEEEEYYLSLM